MCGASRKSENLAYKCFEGKVDRCRGPVLFGCPELASGILVLDLVSGDREVPRDKPVASLDLNCDKSGHSAGRARGIARASLGPALSLRI